jgi:hypothetical protein
MIISKMFADKTLVDARNILCNACPDKTSVFSTDVCGKCGCVLAAKTKLSGAMCPAGKWDSIPKD